MQAIETVIFTYSFVTLKYGKAYVGVRIGLRWSTEIFLWSTECLTLKYERKGTAALSGVVIESAARIERAYVEVRSLTVHESYTVQ